MRFDRLSLNHEGVLGIGRLVVSLFRRCTIFCKKVQVMQWMAFRRLYWTPIFQSIQRLQTWTLPSPHWRLYRRYFFYNMSFHSQRWEYIGTQEINQDHWLFQLYLYVIHWITSTLCKKLYIGETGRRLWDRYRGHLRDLEKDDQNASKPLARHLNLPNPNHSKQHMHGSLRHFPSSRKHGRPQNSGPKIYFSNRHS